MSSLRLLTSNTILFAAPLPCWHTTPRPRTVPSLVFNHQKNCTTTTTVICVKLRKPWDPKTNQQDGKTALLQNMWATRKILPNRSWRGNCCGRNEHLPLVGSGGRRGEVGNLRKEGAAKTTTSSSSRHQLIEGEAIAEIQNEGTNRHTRVKHV